ncbi:MAG: hypothetical protein WBA35_12690 [Litorimonas sp.]
MKFSGRNAQILGLVLLAIAVKLYIDHRSPSYTGPYNTTGSYATISSTKHDVSKALFVELFIMLMMGGFMSEEEFFSTDNFLKSWVGKVTVTGAAFFVFHEMFQPYILAKLPMW